MWERPRLALAATALMIPLAFVPFLGSGLGKNALPCQEARAQEPRSAALRAPEVEPTEARFAEVGSAEHASPAPFQVERFGQGDPMILIPGMTSSGDVWAGMVERYGDRYELHALTLAGFAGVPPLEEGPFLPVVRDALLDYIREEGLEEPVLVGHSLGAFLAFWVAASAPDLVGPIIAVDGVPFLPALSDPSATPEGMAESADQVRAFYATLTPEQMEAQARMAATGMVRDPAHVATIASWGRDSSPSTAGQAFAEMLTTDLRGEVTRIRAPVLLFLAGGGFSDGQLEGAVARYREQIAGIPRTEVRAAADARHFIMWDDPDLLFHAIDGFLEGS